MTYDETYRQVRQTVGYNVWRFRRENHQSQEHFAFMTGLSRPYICRIEHGQANITVRAISRIADGMGQPVSALLVDADGKMW